MQTTDRYAVFGNPIAHSKSPVIHRMFAEQTGQRLVYTAELSDDDHFADDVRAFFQTHGKGINITVPFKQAAWSLADTRSERAQRAGAVNTLVRQSDGHLFGDTTDGTGLARDLHDNHRITLQDRSLLVIGAGGAVRGVIEALLALRPARLLVANRTAARAIEIAGDFQALGPIEGGGLDTLGGQSFDVVINGTSASLQGKLPDLPGGLFRADSTACDMMYGASPTRFLQWAGEQGATRTIDGLGMLVEQAAESFYLWRKVRPQTAPVIDALRQQMEKGATDK